MREPEREARFEEILVTPGDMTTDEASELLKLIFGAGNVVTA